MPRRNCSQLVALFEHYFEILSTFQSFLPALFQDFTSAIGKGLLVKSLFKHGLRFQSSHCSDPREKNFFSQLWPSACGQTPSSLFFYRVSEMSARARERQAATPRETRGQFNNYYKYNLEVQLLFLDTKTMGTKENYSCKIFIKLAPPSPVSCLQSRVWSFPCLARFA